MRGFKVAAALLLAPALTGALNSIKSEQTVPSAFVTWELPKGAHGLDTLTLRLDVEETGEACSPASVRINTQSLSLNSDGFGEGLLLDNATSINARWAVTCVDSITTQTQLMRFTITAVDGETVNDVEFSALFRQTAPVRISEVSGASYVYRLSMPYAQQGGEVIDGSDAQTIESVADKTLVMQTQTLQTEVIETQAETPEVDETTPDSENARPHHGGPPSWDAPPPEFEHIGDEIDRDLQDIAMLRAQVIELQAIIRNKEAHVQEKLGHGHHGPPPPTFGLLKQCSSFRCIVDTLSEKVKHTASDFFGHHPPHHPHHPPHHPHEHPGHHPKGNHTDDQCPPHCRPGPPHHGPPHHGPPHHGPPPPPPPPPFWHGDHHGPPPPWHHGPPHRPHHDDDKRPDFDAAEGPAHDETPEPPHHDKHGHHGPPHDPEHEQTIITAIGMAAIGLSLFILFGIIFILRRLSNLDSSSRRAIRRALRQPRHARGRGIFARLINGSSDDDDDEEKEMMLNQRRTSDDEATMEQDIAQFRRAASVVEGLVTVDQGCTTRNPYPGYNLSQEGLPSYDDEEHNNSVVSDGYMPGMGGYTPSNTASNADNVLGDSKN